MRNNLFIKLCENNEKTVQEIALKLAEELGEVIVSHANINVDNGEEYREELVDLYMVGESLKIKLQLKNGKTNNTVQLLKNPLMRLVQITGLISEATLAVGNVSGSQYKVERVGDSIADLIAVLVSTIKELFNSSIDQSKNTTNTFDYLLEKKSRKWARVTGMNF